MTPAEVELTQHFLTANQIADRYIIDVKKLNKESPSFKEDAEKIFYDFASELDRFILAEIENAQRTDEKGIVLELKDMEIKCIDRFKKETFL
jgi:hypothetical protein